MKHLFSGLLIAVVVMLPGMSLAAGNATMSFAEVTVSAEQGESFDLTVQVQPNGEALDTVRSIVTYDPATLSAQYVTLTGAFDRSAPGNYIDNRTGKVSWGGFTLDGPVSSTTSFVSINFLALQEGTTAVSINGDSRAISAGTENIDPTDLGSSVVTVGAAAVADPTLSLVILESDSHPDQNAWYSNASVNLNWIEIAADSRIASYLYDFDQSSSTDPSTALAAGSTEMTQEVTEDGIYYFHIKGVQTDGRETDVVHHRVQVDTTDPNPIELSVQDAKLLEGESAWFTFATTDDTAGVLQYQIALNSSDFKVQSSPLEMEDLDPGTYFFRVVALDRAGNTAYGSTSVRVYPEGTDVDRPEGYEPASEITAVVSSLSGSDDETASSTQTLITLVLGVLIALGLIYAIARRKKS
ncbi:MAG: hypothetical protein HQ488_00185 [Parcubacteria group bacterium]|nr:hypothetical protein [Parcubacteria group bacterium]